MNSPTPPNPPEQPLRTAGPACPEPARQLHDLLAALWSRSRATIAERLSVLRAAQLALEHNPADLAAHAAGADAAHKLAGILGTFGLPRGTDLARGAELLLEAEPVLGEAQMADLRQWIDELEGMVQRKSLDAASIIK